MKKFAVVILALIYLGTSNGIMVQMHYCMGMLVGWGLGVQNSNICSGCGMEESAAKDKDCCKETHKFFKADSDAKITGPAFELAQQVPLAPPVTFIELPATNQCSFSDSPINHPPPLNHSIPAYILYHDYRI